jgi:hypothetical protein
VAGAAANAEDEQPPSALAHLGQAGRHGVEQSTIERTAELGDKLRVPGAMLADRHGDNSLAGRRPKGAPAFHLGCAAHAAEWTQSGAATRLELKLPG